MSHSLPETETRNIRYRSACQRRQRYRFSGTSDQCCMAIYTSYAVSPERRCSTHHAEAEIWRHYSDTSWRLTLAACPSANNVQVVYHCLYKRLHCRHETASSCVFRLQPALAVVVFVQQHVEIWWITQFCSLRTTCLEWSATDFACFIHHTWTVPEQTKGNTISHGLRDVTWRFRDC